MYVPRATTIHTRRSAAGPAAGERCGAPSVGRTPSCGSAHGRAAEPHPWLPGLGPLSPPADAWKPARGDRVDDVGLLGLVLATVHGSCSLTAADPTGFNHQTTPV